jgi:parvulin-like peptidyl-prolyl isomerase
MSRGSAALALVLGIVVLVAGLAGCGATESNDPLSAATVNGTSISLADYQTILALYKAGATRQGQGVDWQNPSGRANLTATEQQAMDFLVNLEIAREQLKKPVTSSDTKAERDRLNQLRAQLSGSNQDAGSQALAQSVTPRAVTLLSDQSAIQTQLIQQASVPTYHVRGILVKTMQDAQNYEQQAQHGSDFGQLAHDHSLDSSTSGQNGDLGTIYPGQLGITFDQVAFAKGAHPGNYVIIPISGEYALLELTQPAQSPLKSISDSQTQQSVYTAWLTDIVRPQVNIQQHILLG